MHWLLTHALNCMRSTACAQLRALNCMLQKATLSALVVCCGLLAKWLRVKVRVRVRVMAGARECTSCTFFPLWFISVVNTSVFVGSVYSLRKCARRVTYGYSIDYVTAWSWVNLATPPSPPLACRGSCMSSGGAPTPLAHRCSKFHTYIKCEVKT